MNESRENRLRRLRLRSWRRGMRETDLILGPFADRHLAALDQAGLDAFEALLDRPDPDIFAWIAGRTEPVPELAAIVGRIREAIETGE
ncbi:MAG: succinate dehydrogenase assembly factor 2 [Alphaproteobacteria bacterium]|nr:MAG: succinate dehydrogenase assembly factor 2 [Alphaproteobacteria bacterium]